MNWFSARLLFQSKIDRKVIDEPLLEESIWIFRASSPEEAMGRAESIGKENEHSYLNDEGEEVSWVFVKTLEVQDLVETEIRDATEVYSFLYYSSEAV